MHTYKPWLPVIGWMLFIFVMSTDAGAANQTSRILEPLLHWVNPNISREGFDQVHYVVRKSAHLSEYAVLALLLFRALRLSLGPRAAGWSWGIAGIALLIAVTYAATDEWHQTFVSSRTASLLDVRTDSIGALAGLAFVFVRHKWTGRFSPAPLR